PTAPARAIISSGSPFAVIAASRRSASKNPNCPIVPTPANLVVTNQTRTNSRRSLFFEVPKSLNHPGEAWGGEPYLWPRAYVRLTFAVVKAQTCSADTHL